LLSGLLVALLATLSRILLLLPGLPILVTLLLLAALLTALVLLGIAHLSPHEC
jgi:hypothetical protein